MSSKRTATCQCHRYGILSSWIAIKCILHILEFLLEDSLIWYCCTAEACTGTGTHSHIPTMSSDYVFISFVRLFQTVILIITKSDSLISISVEIVRKYFYWFARCFWIRSWRKNEEWSIESIQIDRDRKSEHELERKTYRIIKTGILVLLFCLALIWMHHFISFVRLVVCSARCSLRYNRVRRNSLLFYLST